MVEVQLRRSVHGCIYWPLVLMSFGVIALVLPLAERHFIRRMDASGVETRAGKRIAWNEFTEARRVVATMGGAELVNEILLKSPKGQVSLPLWRTVNAREALDYAMQHLPRGLFPSRER